MTQQVDEAQWDRIRVLANRCINEAEALLPGVTAGHSTAITYTYSCLLNLDVAIERRGPLLSRTLTGRGSRLRALDVWSYYDPEPREEPLLFLLRQLQDYWFKHFTTEATKRSRSEMLAQITHIDAREL